MLRSDDSSHRPRIERFQGLVVTRRPRCFWDQSSLGSRRTHAFSRFYIAVSLFFPAFRPFFFLNRGTRSFYSWGHWAFEIFHWSNFCEQLFLPSFLGRALLSWITSLCEWADWGEGSWVQLLLFRLTGLQSLSWAPLFFQQHLWIKLKY